jgi:hypothetical protein
LGLVLQNNHNPSSRKGKGNKNKRKNEKKKGMSGGEKKGFTRLKKHVSNNAFKAMLCPFLECT